MSFKVWEYWLTPTGYYIGESTGWEPGRPAKTSVATAMGIVLSAHRNLLGE